jgi:sugar lactone lactonase YvrE
MIEIIANLRCELGEGLIWDYHKDLLLMTDITKNRLISIDIDRQIYKSWFMPEKIGWVLLTDKLNLYIVGLETGIALFSTENNSQPKMLNQDFPALPMCRLNDACTDRFGRIWYGSMNYNDESSNDGMVASFSNTSGVKIHDKGFTVTNGPVISPEDDYLLLNDSLKRTLYKYDFSILTGQIFNRTVFMKFEPEQGIPDGMCFDIEGNLWLAMWGAGKVLKVSRQGEILHEYNIPAPNVTNVCFGGANLDRLFISSATIGLEESNASTFLQSGSVFELKNHCTRGYNSHLVKLEI